MFKNRLIAIMIMLILLLPVAFLGCSSGGGYDAPVPTPRPIIKVSPSSYDFGTVTPNNSPAALEVEIQNNGSSALTVSDITLTDPNYVLNLDLGSKPCFTASSTIPAGDKCTFEVNFTPGSDGAFDAVLTINSDDSTNPTINVLLSGIREPASELNVRINQVESTSCPTPVVTSYVSVTDQGGYPVTTLTVDDFSITEVGGYAGPPTGAPFVSDVSATISVALAMDYSGSITFVEDSQDDMEASVVSFVDQLGSGDEAEIIKFSGINKVASPGFTSDKTLLTDAIYDPLDVDYELGTALYDAAVKAVDDTALRSKDRKAVIIITDGEDSDGSGQLSNNSLNDAINNAKSKGIPIFTVGLGKVNIAVLQQMADDTGGQFYSAVTSDNLRNIYNQLAAILFQDQYVLTYNSGLGAGDTANLTIEATEATSGARGNDTKGITPCP